MFAFLKCRFPLLAGMLMLGALSFVFFSGCKDPVSADKDTLIIKDTGGVAKPETLTVSDTSSSQKLAFSTAGDSLYITDTRYVTKVIRVYQSVTTILSEKDTTISDTVTGGKIPAGTLVVRDTVTKFSFAVSAAADSLLIYDTTITTKTLENVSGIVTLISSTDTTWSDTLVGGKVPSITLTDASINAGDTVTLNANITYVLQGFVFVEKGAVLTIPAGTVIKGKAGGGLNASALIICRGAKIYAEGTATNPIIMTSDADDLAYADDLSLVSRGMWGGLIVLGCANTNLLAGYGQIEGLKPDDPRGRYGADSSFALNEADNSGVIRYVSLRYGGTNIGEGNEINGLTMGAVGSGTTIEHVEVFNNDDDGFEWFGGTVNCKYLVSTGCADDNLDWDEGFKGKIQFVAVVQEATEGDRGIEADGSAADNRGTPAVSAPTLYNLTMVGSGAASVNMDNCPIKLREETKAKIYNSIFTDFKGNMSFNTDGSLKGAYVLDIDDGTGSAGNLVSDHMLSGQTKISSNIFYGFGKVTGTAPVITDSTKLVKFASGKGWVLDSIIAWGNTFNVNPQLTSITRGTGAIDLRPVSGSPALSGAAEIPAGDTFFTPTTYRGAFSATDTWWDWTFTKAVY